MFRRRGSRGDQHGAASVSTERAQVLRNPRDWPAGWAGFEKPWGEGSDETETFAAAFDEQLRREVARGHVLYNEHCLAIAKREATDDVLFAVGEERVAVAHLTWAQKPETPHWPSVTLYSSFEEFLSRAAEDFGE